MEEVIAMISQARQTGQNLRDVIPPDYLTILEEAEVREKPGVLWRGGKEDT